MTAIRQIAKKSLKDLSEDEKEKLSTFEKMGCMQCHMIEKRQIKLTELGQRIFSFHMSCPNVIMYLTK